MKRNLNIEQLVALSVVFVPKKLGQTAQDLFEEAPKLGTCLLEHGHWRRSALQDWDPKFQPCLKKCVQKS